MARQPRLTLPGQVHHLMQCGNNRQAIVLCDADRTAWLELLAVEARNQRVAVHAYLLLDTAFQLLVTPETGDGVPRLMQALGRSYVRHFNDAHQRTGTLWEGRYRSTLIQPGRYLLPCMVYLDGAPVRAGLVTEPAAYRWSSHRHWCGQVTERLITPHPICWQLGNTPFAREAAYAEMVQAGLGERQLGELQTALRRGWALGDADFLAGIQTQTQRRVAPRQPGRPRRTQTFTAV